MYVKVLSCPFANVQVCTRTCVQHLHMTVDSDFEAEWEVAIPDVKNSVDTCTILSHRELLRLPSSEKVKDYIESLFARHGNPFQLSGSNISSTLGEVMLCNLAQACMILYQRAQEEWKSERELLEDKITRLSHKQETQKTRKKFLLHGSERNMLDTVLDAIASLNTKRNQTTYNSQQIVNGLVPVLPLLGRSYGLRSMEESLVANLACLVGLASEDTLDTQAHKITIDKIREALKGVFPSREVLKDHLLGLSDYWRCQLQRHLETSSAPLIIYMDGTEIKKGRRDKQEMVIVECEGERTFLPYALEREKGTDLVACLENALGEEVLYRKKSVILCTDGGSANTGKQIGAAALINAKRKEEGKPEMLHIVCLSHALHNAVKEMYEWVKEDIAKHFPNEVYEWASTERLKTMKKEFEEKKKTLKEVKTRTVSKDGKKVTETLIQGGPILEALEYLMFSASSEIGSGKSRMAHTSVMNEYRLDRKKGCPPTDKTPCPKDLDVERLLHMGFLDEIMWRGTEEQHKKDFMTRFYPEPKTTSGGKTQESSPPQNVTNSVEQHRKRKAEGEVGGAMVPLPIISNPSRFLFALDVSMQMSLYANAYIYGYDQSEHHEMFTSGGKGIPKWRKYLDNHDARVIMAVLGLSLMPVLKSHLLKVQRKKWAGAAACQLVRFIGEDVNNMLFKWADAAETEASNKKKRTERKGYIPPYGTFQKMGLTPSDAMLQFLRGDSFLSWGDRLQSHILERQGGAQQMWLKYPHSLLGLVQVGKKGALEEQIDTFYRDALKQDANFMEDLKKAMGEESSKKLNNDNITTWRSLTCAKGVVINSSDLPASSVPAEGGFSKLERQSVFRPSMEQETRSSYMHLSSAPITNLLRYHEESYVRFDPREQSQWVHWRKLSQESCTILQEKKKKVRIDRETEEIMEQNEKYKKVQSKGDARKFHRQLYRLQKELQAAEKEQRTADVQRLKQEITVLNSTSGRGKRGMSKKKFL